MLDKFVLVLRWRAGEDSEAWPNEVELLLHHIAMLVLDTLVELLALDDQEVIWGIDDATFARDRARRANIVTRDHADNDSGPLELADSLGYSVTYRVLDGAHDQTRQTWIDGGLVGVPVKVLWEQLIVEAFVINWE